MRPELDHIFIMCNVEAPEAETLKKIGLIEGPGNIHPGQGTACRRFFFPHQYVELLWIRDRAEAQNETTRPTQLWDRWSARRHGACPFGLVFRPAADPVSKLPFPTWSYRPGYLPTGMALEIATGTPIDEPEFFFLPALESGVKTAPTHHSIPGTEMTHLRIGTPRVISSKASRWAESTALISFEHSTEYVLTITF